MRERPYTVRVAVEITVRAQNGERAAKQAEAVVSTRMAAHKCHVEWIGVEEGARDAE